MSRKKNTISHIKKTLQDVYVVKYQNINFQI